MVNERGGLAAARDLLHARRPAEGLSILREHGRLDLSAGGDRRGGQAAEGSRPRFACYNDAMSEARKPALLSGGNPQISKGYGNEPVQAYISAMPGWKNAVGRRLDDLIERTLPGVQKAVKWNSPFYGMEGDRWFLSYHCFTSYVKVTFFRGASVDPLPAGTSKHPDVRYLDIREDEDFDSAQFVDWVKQASRLPGEKM
jgi:hypothetical protein